MREWGHARLGDAAEIVLGGTPSTERPEYWNGSVAWMASGDVHQRVVDDVPGRITELGLQSSNANLVEPPAVAVALAGQGKTRGTVALTRRLLSTNQSVALLKGHVGVLDTSYLFHSLGGRYEELRARSSGGGRGGLSKRVLSAIPIALPPLQEQRRIAEILDTIDEAIQATERVIAKLTLIARGLVRAELHRLGGEPRTLGELARFTNGFSFRAEEWTDSGYPIIRIQNLNGSTEFNFFSGAPHPGWHVQPGDLLFAWSGMRETSFGPALWAGPEGVLNQHIFKLDVDEAVVDKRFLYMLLEDQKLKIADLAHGFKDSFVHVTRSELTGYQVRVPDLEDQRLLVATSGASSSRLEAERSTLEKLQRIRAGLASDLLSGRVRTVAA